MTVILGLVVGFLASRLVWLVLRPTFASVLFERHNYRDHPLPTAVGLVIAVAVVVIEAVRVVVAAALDQDRPLDGMRLGSLVLVVGLALLGLVDDLAGNGDRRGFRGHLRALAGGHLTTGALKLLGGAALSVVAVAIVGRADDLAVLLSSAAVVALAANLGNLFDRAPGRTTKVGTLVFLGLLVAIGVDDDFATTAVVVGAALALLLDDLHERLMLGDTGANLLGGAIGLAAVATVGSSTRYAVLGALVVLNGLSEFVSFSRVIDGFPPLRILDRAGRRRADMTESTP